MPVIPEGMSGHQYRAACQRRDTPPEWYGVRVEQYATEVRSWDAVLAHLAVLGRDDTEHRARRAEVVVELEHWQGQVAELEGSPVLF